MRTVAGFFAVGFCLSRLSGSLLYAQERDSPFDQLTIEHGLPNNQVNAILQDSQGFLWFGTYDGLARYDGAGFKVYT